MSNLIGQHQHSNFFLGKIGTSPFLWTDPSILHGLTDVSFWLKIGRVCRISLRNHCSLTMITDVQLGVFCNILGVSLMLLVVLYHYVVATSAQKPRTDKTE